MELNKFNEYINAIETGFYLYGLNGFYSMHEEVCSNKIDPWENSLRTLNDLDSDEFKLLCEVYLKANK